MSRLAIRSNAVNTPASSLSSSTSSSSTASAATIAVLKSLEEDSSAKRNNSNNNNNNKRPASDTWAEMNDSLIDEYFADVSPTSSSSSANSSPKPPSATPAASGKKTRTSSSPSASSAVRPPAARSKAQTPKTGVKTQQQQQRKSIPTRPLSNNNNRSRNSSSSASINNVDVPLPPGLTLDAEPGKDVFVYRTLSGLIGAAFFLASFCFEVAALVVIATAPRFESNREILRNPAPYIIMGILFIAFVALAYSAFSVTVTFDKVDKLVSMDLHFYLYPCCSGATRPYSFSDIIEVAKERTTTTASGYEVTLTQVDLVIKDIDDGDDDGKSYVRLFSVDTCIACCVDEKKRCEENVLLWENYLKVKLGVDPPMQNWESRTPMIGLEL